MIGHDQFLVSGNCFIYFPFTLFHYYLLYFTHMFCLQGTSLGGGQRVALMEVLTAPELAAPEQAPPEEAPLLMIDEAMNQAFGTSYEEEDEAEEEADEGQ
jgi:hypothetical protein